MKKENLPVLIAIGLPVLLILIVAGLVFFQSGMEKPKHNFVYTQSMWPYAYSYAGSECTIYSNYYEIDGDRLLKKGFSTSTPRTTPDYQARMKTLPTIESGVDYCNGYARVVKKDAPDLYLYEAALDTVRVIPFEEASKLTLAPGVISPDGYTVGPSYENAGIFEIFGGGNSYGIYATKQNRKVQLSVPQTNQYNTGEFGFIAWINN